MATVSLDDLSSIARGATEPAQSSRYTPRPGGVDPLGLRQINFDLMDQVIPGLNNVAGHIRPFTVVCWAWRRAAECARDTGRSHVDVSELRDFVNRIEVLFAWSQFLLNPNADLPGRDVLAPLVRSGSYRFAGSEWKKRKEIREYSTALSAPVNYGPALKTFGWLQPDSERTGAMIPSPHVQQAIDSLYLRISAHLHHPAFSSLGEVTVEADSVVDWAKIWVLDDPSEMERQAMAETFFGEFSALRSGAELIRATVNYLSSSEDVVAVRQAMCGKPSQFTVPDELSEVSEKWRKLQVRQLFRFALEALFHWCIQQLDDGPKTTTRLVQLFLNEAGVRETTQLWVDEALDVATGPVECIEQLQTGLFGNTIDESLPTIIRRCLSTSLSESPRDCGLQQHDRLPNGRAASEMKRFADRPPQEFLSHVFESWIIGQHVYWAVGRGLSDARARDKMILRLKVILEEHGWTLAPGVSASNRNAPNPTPDRLATALSLLRESGSIA